MGRRPTRKKGAFTAAERQARRRKRLRAERRQQEQAEKRAENEARYREHIRDRSEPEPLPPPVPPLPDRADELAWQIAEFMQEDGELTIDDVRAALDRRFGCPVDGDR